MNRNTIICLALTTLFFASCKKEEQVLPPSATNPVVKPFKPEMQKPQPKPIGSEKPTEMTFAEKSHDFGTIKQGDKVAHIFTFKNTGDHDLIISRAVGSCGCTVPEYPKEPIAPGKSGTMKVSFNSTGKSGQQHKTVTITANVPNYAEVLEITANVIKEE